MSLLAILTSMLAADRQGSEPSRTRAIDDNRIIRIKRATDNPLNKSRIETLRT